MKKKVINILLLSILILAFVIYLLFWKNDMSKKIEFYVSSLEYPLWLLDINEIERISSVILEDHEINKIEILDHKGQLLFNNESSNHKLLIKYSKTVFFEGVFLGTINLYIYPIRIINSLIVIIILYSLFYSIVSLYLKNSEKAKKLMKLNNDLIQTNEELEETLAELEKTQEVLINSEKMAALGKLMINIAHDINTPTGIIYSSATEIQNRLNNKNNIEKNEIEIIQKLVEIIIKNAQKIAKFVQSLKRTTFHEVSDTNSYFNIKDLISDVLETLSPKLKRNNLKILLDLDDKVIFSNPGAIAQILMNLIDNAINHAFKEKNNNILTISAHVNKNILKLIISDNGIGISKDLKQKIFEPFFTTDFKNGTGLGLSIVHHLVVNTLKGNIELETEENKGTTLIITIPIKKEEKENNEK